MGADIEDVHQNSIKRGLSFKGYDAETIRQEFRTYQSVLPRPDILLQEQHSAEMLRGTLIKANIQLPRYMKEPEDGGVAPHYALCCLLNSEIAMMTDKDGKFKREDKRFESFLVWFFSFGCLTRSINRPAAIIREQYQRVAHVLPTDTIVRASRLRKLIRHAGLPIPNFFLDPETDRQFPPHIAILVVLQDGEKESRHFENELYKAWWMFFAIMALVLRLVLEVIGGAGAIWGGSEVFGLRNADNKELWRWLSIGVGILCFLRFITLNAPQQGDEGDILGPAGPWSLRGPARLRAVCEHPFHYFARAQSPYATKAMKKIQ